MAVSHQHLRESQALHFDYYSKKKKTASALRKRIHHCAMRAIGDDVFRSKSRFDQVSEKPRRCDAAFHRTI
jgi:hypothetical protein